MAVGGSRYEEVRSVTQGLEVSPSRTDSSGLSRRPKISAGSGQRAANASRYTLSTNTGEFQMSDRGKRLPNYVREFARGARQST